MKTTEGVYQRKKRKNGRNAKEKLAIDRKREFPNAPFKVDGFDLVCMICNTKLSLKYSTINGHLNSKSHIGNIQLKDKNQQTLVIYAAAIQKRESTVSTAGLTLPLDTLAYRMKVTYALLRTGTPFTVLDFKNPVRGLFEDLHCTLPKDSCASFIPVLNDMEAAKTKEELIQATGFSLCSDGTMNVAECLAMVID